jgi:HK97 family phage major capsid protein
MSAGEITDEVRTQFDGLMDEVARLDADIVRAEKLQAVEQRAVQQQQPVGAPAVHNRRTPDTEEGIYCRWVRSGDAAAQRELMEMRASNNTDMNVGTAADGGDLVPTGHYNQIIERLRPLSLPERLGVMQIPGQGLTVNVPIDNEADDGAFVSTNESAAFDRDAPARIRAAIASYVSGVAVGAVRF